MIYNMEKHKNNDPYPNKSDFTTYFVYKRGECVLKGDASVFCGSVQNVIEAQGLKPLDSFTVNKCLNDAIYTRRILESTGFMVELAHDGYKEACDVWAKKHNELENLFVTELMNDCSLPTEKLRSLCYSFAYDRGHSAGMSEVENYMISIEDDIERIVTATIEGIKSGEITL